MGNTPRLGQWRPPVTEDMGLGYCYNCIQFMTTAIVGKCEEDIAGFVPNLAVTLAPWPMPMPGVVLALPACFPCLIGEGTAGKPRQGLAVANGRIPGH